MGVRVMSDRTGAGLYCSTTGMAFGPVLESEAEAEVCRDMGFQLIQGYLTGRPALVPATRP